MHIQPEQKICISQPIDLASMFIELQSNLSSTEWLVEVFEKTQKAIRETHKNTKKPNLTIWETQ